MKLKRLLCISALVLLLALLLSSCAKVPLPKVREGKFNFSVTYEVNGEQKTISGVYICTFIRPSMDLTGIYREWSGYIEGNSDLDESDIEVLTTDDGVISLDLGLSPQYFMADPFYDLSGALGAPEASLLLRYNEDIAPDMGYFSTDPEVIAEYGVKIISCEYDEPIENVYE